MPDSTDLVHTGNAVEAH